MVFQDNGFSARIVPSSHIRIAYHILDIFRLQDIDHFNADVAVSADYSTVKIHQDSIDARLVIVSVKAYEYHLDLRIRFKCHILDRHLVIHRLV